MTDTDEVDFLEAVDRKAAAIRLTSGSEIRVSKLSFLQHLLVSKARAKEDDDLVVKAHAVDDVLRIALDERYMQISVDDVFRVLAYLNASSYAPMLPWQSAQVKDVHQHATTTNSQYAGREVAWIVSLLCETYGWTSGYVLNELTYAEVCCFVQEAMIVHHARESFFYNLSEVGFRKSGTEYVKIPYPELPWVKHEAPKDEQTKVRIPAKYMPDGVIMDYSNFAETGKVDTYEIPSVRASAGAKDDSETSIGDNGDSS